MNNSYHFFFHIGYWFTLGCLLALAITSLLGVLINKVVSKIPWFKGKEEDVKQYVFSNLPISLKSMRLVYSKEAETMTASCLVLIAGKYEPRAYAVPVTAPSSLKPYAENAQLELMTAIHKEISK